MLATELQISNEFTVLSIMLRQEIWLISFGVIIRRLCHKIVNPVNMLM